ncbi:MULTISPECIES: RagB/SusD family nutrient uptake outer membrane protein [Flavobacteriaceae]|uniref:RagB/SusD family nutrient uptake outer membrane protein n=1 Tax=Flavobacteriaceae TaxID=49546 RepID=UPI00149178BE|nr:MULTISPECIES: RagB/SusD family nutrient uptake outer membrane protein [Allomuricauda]MDC6367700.1 RagB/SusD family nutrient uptake outer membrane protein [Muricauda sp. AC10]
MKKRIFLSITLVFALFISCDEDALDKVNPNELSPDTFFKTAAQVESAATGTYAHLQNRGLYTRHMFFMMDNMAQENGRNQQLESDKVEYIQFSFNSNHGPIGEYWKACYRGINNCNLVINNADKINELNDSELSSEMKAKFIGEAKFMRALYYFFLVTRFGGVPINDGLTTEAQPRSSADQVYDLIIQDLTEASSALRSKNVEDTGRATREAAIAMLGKVYLFRNNKSAALAEFEKIYGAFQLEDNYFDNFTEEGEFGPESIFEIVYDDEIGGSAWGETGTGLNEITFRGQEYGLLNWYNVHITDDLLDEYETGDGRIQDNFYQAGDDYCCGTIQESDLADASGTIYRAGWKKYQNYHAEASEDAASGINFKYLRYADVLLMMAECVYENDPAAAVGYINEVRTRPSTGLAPLPTTLSSSEVFDAIVHERKCELAGEQVRFNDIIRWGNAATELAGSNFQAGKHELLPIPAAEINANAALTEADQNPGY